MYKIIYPSITKDELTQINQIINDWFVNNRDNEYIRQNDEIAYEAYTASSKGQKFVTIFLTTVLFTVAYVGYRVFDFSITTCVTLLAAAVIDIVIALYIENILVRHYADSEFQNRMDADNAIDMTNRKYNPLKFTMYDISHEKFINHDFSDIKRVHMYTDIVRKLIWLKDANVINADDLSIENDVLTFTPMVGQRKLVPLQIDTKAASVYNNYKEDVIDLSKLKTCITNDLKQLNEA